MAATINYLASDRPDLQYTANMLGRTMAKPTTRSWSNLKKAARCLKEHPRVKYEYHDVTMDEVKSWWATPTLIGRGARGTAEA